MNMFKTKYTKKYNCFIVFSLEHASNPVASVQIQYYIIIFI